MTAVVLRPGSLPSTGVCRARRGRCRPGRRPRRAPRGAGACRRACPLARTGVFAEGDHCDGYGGRGPRRLYDGMFDAEPEPCARHSADAPCADRHHPPRCRRARSSLRLHYDGAARLRPAGRFCGAGARGRRLFRTMAAACSRTA